MGICVLGISVVGLVSLAVCFRLVHDVDAENMRSGIADRKATGVSNIDELTLDKRLTGNLDANSLRFSARPADAMISPVVFASRGRSYRSLDRDALRLAAVTIDEVFSRRFVAVGDGSRR